MTEVQQQKKVLWPELSRFGAKLTVAFNPSVGESFLKFTIFDRKLYEQTCGYARGDVYDIARSSGFYYATTEAKSRSSYAYDAALSDGASVEEADEAVNDSLQSLCFYNPLVDITKREWIRKLIPAVLDSDYKQLAISDIKHFDHSYLGYDQMQVLLAQQQAFEGALPGVFYTTPVDRSLLVAAQTSPVSVNELLAFKDLPPGAVAGRKELTAAQQVIASFNSVPMVERLMVGQTLGANGMPLKAPSLKGVVVAYVSKDAAIQANGGVEAGLERLELPFAMPVAFDYPSRRLLVVRDSRYLEVPNLLKLPEADADPQNVQGHWDVLAKAAQLLAQFDELRAAGLLDIESWNRAEVLEQIESKFMRISDTMSSILQPHVSGNFIEHTDLIKRSGLSAVNFTNQFAPGFLHFLGQFKRSLYPQMAELRAKRLAESVVRARGANTVQPASAARNELGRREDSGEKIGGARKDYAKRSLSVAEVNSLTLREMGEVVNKDNVWPPLNYVGMRDAGVDPAVAYIIKELRTALPVNPLKGGRNMRRISVSGRTQDSLTAQACVNFIAAVSIVRDALAEVKTANQLLHAVKRIYEEAGGRVDPRNRSMGYRAVGAMAVGEAFLEGAGTKFWVRAMPTIEIDDGVPSSYAFTRMTLGAEARTQGKWDWAIRERAPRAAQDRAERREPPVRHLEVIMREGPDLRSGADVDERTFLQRYGFRAVEYGRWLPQSERQIVLNHAYDAFGDLAKVLDLPERALGLNGRMAIAFGARGTGGQRAAVAHFEPARFVMNLTRMRGAGSLAHEYGHALDCALAEATGISKMELASEVKMRAGGMPPIVAGLRSLIAVAKTRYLTKDEALAKYAQSSSNASLSVTGYLEKAIHGWIDTLDSNLPPEARRGQFQEVARGLFRSSLVPIAAFESLGIKDLPDPSGFANSVFSLYERFSNGVPAADSLRMVPERLLTWYDSRLKALHDVENDFLPTAFKADSAFFEDAKWFDENRSKSYWSTDCELFARAFECWVQQRVERDGVRCSQYLVHSCVGGGALEGHSAYPRGDDLVRLDAAFTSYFSTFRAELCKLMDLGEAAPARQTNNVGISLDM